MKLIQVSADKTGDIIARPSPSGIGRVVALGFFDGLHTGHRALIDCAISRAFEEGLESSIFTFSDQGMKPGEARLMSFDERLEAIGSSGIFTTFCGDFPSLRSVTPETFVRDVLIGICSASVAVCGWNFRFGCKASGDALQLRALMRRYGGDAVILPPVELDGVSVSSSAIREALAEGDMITAARMLGRPYSLKARVEHGAKLGRRLDFPTVNQYFTDGCVIPRYGVYITECRRHGDWLPSVCNIGVRPTVDRGAAPRCETNIFDFSEEVYGRIMTVRFLKFLRPEMPFADTAELKEQISKDVAAAKEYFAARKSER